MNGPQHYAEAERLLTTLPEMQVGADTAARIALAQVHATLALAGATCVMPVADGDARAAWHAAALE